MDRSTESPRGRVLLTGATGYVGGRLLRRLEARDDVALRCLARRPEGLRERVAAETEVFEGDLLEPESLRPALAGVDVAYYLVHSLGASSDFEEYEERCARNFADAARAAGVSRVIYLGGLADESQPLSPHLASRIEVGRILREALPTLELRASVVIGSGSFSFEMVRTLVERLPVMVTPTWVRVPTQPIAIDDLLAYLVQALDLPLEKSEVYDVGGADVVSYGGLMREMARQRGLRRLMIPVPVLTPGLSSRWLGLVTPLYARIGRRLIEGLRLPTVVQDARAREVFDVEPLSVAEAVALALRNEDRDFAETRWSDAASSAGLDAGWGGAAVGPRLIDSRAVEVEVAPERAFLPIERIGGKTGWYAYDWLLRLRAFLDLLVGGVGMRRGRRDPERLRPGDTLDWWRVEAIEPPERLRLAAEMKLPGRAWLEYEVEPEGAGSRIRQVASFEPRGIAGRLYWYGIWPLHVVVFRAMIRGLARAAEGEVPARPPAEL